MKNLVLTTLIGDCPKYALPIFEKYCNKYNLDLHVITERVVNWRDLYYEKFLAVELLDKYDRILFIDGDVLITPQAPNIFEYYPDPTFFYAFHENGYSGQNNRDGFVKETLQGFGDRFIAWPKEWNGKLRYFNSGVMLFSKQHQKALSNFREVDEITGSLPISEQTCLNAIVTLYNLPYYNMEWSWNRGDLGVPDPNLQRYQSNFIHYSGQGYTFYSKATSKYDILRSDMGFLYPEFSYTDLPMELQQFDLLYRKGYNV